MKYHSDYTRIYVQEICDALNGAKFTTMTDASEHDSYSPDNYSTLSKFLQHKVVMPLEIFTFLDQRGLVNRGRCPYTGERIDNSTSPRWTYMRSRAIIVSQQGFAIMKRENNEDYEKAYGEPAPPIIENKNKCYIATACYGNEFANEVIILKSFRDKVLTKYFLGKIFIEFYYTVSPSIARLLIDQKHLNDFIRKYVLDKIVARINKLNNK